MSDGRARPVFSMVATCSAVLITVCHLAACPFLLQPYARWGLSSEHQVEPARNDRDHGGGSPWGLLETRQHSSYCSVASRQDDSADIHKPRRLDARGCF